MSNSRGDRIKDSDGRISVITKVERPHTSFKVPFYLLGFCRNRIWEREASSDDRIEVGLIRDDVCQRGIESIPARVCEET